MPAARRNPKYRLTENMAYPAKIKTGMPKPQRNPVDMSRLCASADCQFSLDGPKAKAQLRPKQKAGDKCIFCDCDYMKSIADLRQGREITTALKDLLAHNPEML